MTRLSAERFNMQQRIKEGQRAARTPKYAVMVIAAKCGHPVDVQLCGDFETNKTLTQQAQAAGCPRCAATRP